jgi:hypothetical protein
MTRKAWWADGSAPVAALVVELGVEYGDAVRAGQQRRSGQKRAPGKDPASMTAKTHNKSIHRQVAVPGYGFSCDRDILELICLMNQLGIHTLRSCQDHNGGRGTARRVWVVIFAEDLLTFLDIIDQWGGDDYVDGLYSLSSRLAYSGAEPAVGWQDYRDNHRWHYALGVRRTPEGISPPQVSIRFPFADLGAVTNRLRAELADQAARAAAGPASP